MEDHRSFDDGDSRHLETNWIHSIIINGSPLRALTKIITQIQQSQPATARATAQERHSTSSFIYTPGENSVK